MESNDIDAGNLVKLFVLCDKKEKKEIRNKLRRDIGGKSTKQYRFTTCFSVAWLRI